MKGLPWRQSCLFSVSPFSPSCRTQIPLNHTPNWSVRKKRGREESSRLISLSLSLSRSIVSRSWPSCASGASKCGGSFGVSEGVGWHLAQRLSEVCLNRWWGASLCSASHGLLLALQDSHTAATGSGPGLAQTKSGAACHTAPLRQSLK